VLVVDDDDDLRDVVMSVLGSHGYHVIGASNGLAAIEVVRQRGSRPAAIVLDLNMPIMDGWAFLDARCAEPLLAHVPVVVTSAAPDRWGVGLPGVAVFLRKPVSMASLLGALRAVCGASVRPRGPSLATGTGSLPRADDVPEDDAPVEAALPPTVRESAPRVRRR
jgi:CheY-like chemotaxis protein